MSSSSHGRGDNGKEQSDTKPRFFHSRGRARGAGRGSGRGKPTHTVPGTYVARTPIKLHCDKRDSSFGCHNKNWFNKELIKYCSQHHVMFIMRGLPGSGKSTITEGVKSLYKTDGVVVCSADDFRVDSFGNYVFDPDQLVITHRQCKEKAESSCKQSVHAILIDNTNIQAFEYEPYLAIGKRYEYPIVFLSMKAGDPHVLSKRNRHDVPLNKIKQMQANYKEDPIPYFYNWTVPFSEAQRLKNIIQSVVQKCWNNDNIFQDFVKGTLRTSPENIFKTFHLAMASCKQLHVTTAYTSECNISPRQSRIYRHSKAVEASLGVPTSLKIIGLVVTKKCFAARVLLTEQQKKLWGADDSLVAGERNPISFESTNPKVQHITSMLKSLQTSDSSDTRATFQPPTSCLKPSHHLGCTAHITLGTRANNKPVEAKEALNNLVYLEASTEFTYEGIIPRNAAFRLYADSGDDILAVYLRRPINIQALFCGYYDIDKKRKV